MQQRIKGSSGAIVPMRPVDIGFSWTKPMSASTTRAVMLASEENTREAPGLRINLWIAAILPLGVLVDALALLRVSRAPDLDVTFPGLVLLAVGVCWLLGLSPLLERERARLYEQAASPQSVSSRAQISRVFCHKALLSALVATLGALPVAVYSLRSQSSIVQAMAGLLYGVACIVLCAFYQAALWLRRVSPTTPTTFARHVLRSLQLSVIAALLATGFARPGIATFLPNLVLAIAFALTFWQGALSRLTFWLDSSVPEPRTVTATYALTCVVMMRAVQAVLWIALARGGMPLSRTAALSFVVAGVLVLTTSVLWLQQRRRVTDIRERLGLGTGKGLRAIVVEGALWSLPAIAVTQGYLAIARRWMAESVEQAARQPSTMELLASSGVVAAIGVGCVAAPIIEELLYRGLLYRALRGGWAVPLSVLVSAAVFAVDHPPLGVVPVFCMAACATLAFERSRSVYAAMLTHALYNGVLAFLMLNR